jgi:hypothetical protein
MTMKQSSLKTLKMSTQFNMQTRRSTVSHCCCCSIAAAVVATLLLLTAWGVIVVGCNLCELCLHLLLYKRDWLRFLAAEASVQERQLMAAEAGPSDALNEDEFEDQEEPPFPEPRTRPMLLAELLALAAEEDVAERVQDSECTLGLFVLCCVAVV